MRSTFMLLAAVVLLLGCGGGADRTADREPGAAADQPQTDTMASASTATADTASDGGLTWGPAPPGLPTGARGAVVSGDPTKAGPFTVRLEMPADYAIRPHHHPTSETLRLLEGTLHLGHGAKWDEKAMKAMATDKPVTMRREGASLRTCRQPRRVGGPEHRPLRDHLRQPEGRPADRLNALSRASDRAARRLPTV